jgi:hypothetical protein
MPVALGRSTTHAAQAELSTVGWFGGADLAYDEWLRQGARLGLAGRSAGWWVGDWVHYGTARYGSKYTAAARVTGYDRQTLMNMVYVATRFDFSRRRENLSWSHHAQLAALEVEQQELWLNRALEEKLSVRDLRDLLQPAGTRPSPRRVAATGEASERALGEVPADSRSHDRGPTADSPTDQAAVVCPHCGHEFVK